jgi:hypothetical protein
MSSFVYVFMVFCTLMCSYFPVGICGFITKLNFVIFSVIVNLVNVHSATVKLFHGGLD